MLKIATLLTVFLIAFPGTAAVFDIRDDAGDMGAVQVVDEINVTKRVNFNEIAGPYGTRWLVGLNKHEGDEWNVMFRGQDITCEYYGVDSLNPDHKPRANPRPFRSDPDKPGFKPNGKLHGKPTSPLTLVRPLSDRYLFDGEGVRQSFYGVYNYPWRSPFSPPGYLIGQSSYAEQLGQGCGDNADDPWSYKFAEPVTAFKIKLSVVRGAGSNCFPIGEKLHIEAWKPDGTHAFHGDITELQPNIEDSCIEEINFAVIEPGVTIAGFSTWVQNGPGIVWWEVASGTPVEGVPEPTPDPDPVSLTLEERVCRLENHVGIGCQ